MKKLCVMAMLILSAASVMGGWSQVAVGGSEHLRSICYLDDSTIFVAGSDGAILQYDGSSWTALPAVTDKNLNAIEMVTSTSGWAAGTEGVILRCEAGVWSVFPTEEDQRTYNDILAFAEDDVYMIGYNLLEGSILFHWDGTDLTEMHTFPDNMVALEGTGPDNIWVAGGNNAIAHYNGTSWDTSMATFPEDTKIFSLCLTEEGNPLITGVRLPSWDLDMLLEYQPDTGWIVVWQGYEKRVMTCAVNEKRGFALGSGGRILEYSIFGWQELSALGNRQFNDIVLPDMAHGWAVGDLGTLYAYEEAAINLELTDPQLSGGDMFDLQAEVINPGPPIDDVMEIIFLETYGMIFFWPTWSSDFAFEMMDLTADYRDQKMILSFEWPSGTGTGESAFWAALLDSQNTILGYDIEEFGWQD
ncbi:MAG TPA: hypothetical protein PLV45_03780 [bacterium]|nr:hypothetical protein [bacterium]